MATQNEIPVAWLDDLEAAWRRTLKQRMKHALVKTYKPVLDDARSRSL